MNQTEFEMLVDIREEQAKQGQQILSLTETIGGVADAINGKDGLIVRQDRTDRFMRFVKWAAVFIVTSMSGIMIQSCSAKTELSAVAAEVNEIEQATPTQCGTPTSTPTPTDMPERTPTPRPLPSIIELTPYSRWELLPGATFTPNVRIFVREGAGKNYPVLYRIEAGKTVQVYAWQENLPDNAWLCLKLGISVFCDEYAALVFNGKHLGVLHYADQP